MTGVTKKLLEDKPAVSDDDVDELFNGSIFKAIEERKRRLLTKSADDWDLASK
jgi:hypothetical protein